MHRASREGWTYANINRLPVREPPENQLPFGGKTDIITPHAASDRLYHSYLTPGQKRIAAALINNGNVQAFGDEGTQTGKLGLLYEFAKPQNYQPEMVGAAVQDMACMFDRETQIVVGIANSGNRVSRDAAALAGKHYLLLAKKTAMEEWNNEKEGIKVGLSSFTREEYGVLTANYEDLFDVLGRITHYSPEQIEMIIRHEQLSRLFPQGINIEFVDDSVHTRTTKQAVMKLTQTMTGELHVPIRVNGFQCLFDFKYATSDPADNHTDHNKVNGRLGIVALGKNPEPWVAIAGTGNCAFTFKKNN